MRQPVPVSATVSSGAPVPLSATPPERPTRQRRARAAAEVPLGSLTQSHHRSRETCRSCGSHRVTCLAMRLTDGTPVDFISCHRCESRFWEHEGEPLDVTTVLDRTRRVA